MADLDPARPTSGLARAHGPALATLDLRRELDDFIVCEELGFEPDGEGAHRWLYVEKRGLDTHGLVQRLARLAGVHARDIGYSGLKDRWSVSRQWFSLPDAAQPLPELDPQGEGFALMRCTRNARKLRRGTHRSNCFRLRLRGALPSPALLDERLHTIARRGVPNYFEAQRFGRRGNNVERARAMFEGARVDRRRRSLYLSAARSFLFNAVLSERVAQGSWERILPGEAVNLDGSRSVFAASDPAELAERLDRHDIHPTGPLWGEGDVLARDQALALENAVVEGFPGLARGLERARVQAMRRALRLPVRELRWQVGEDCLELSFVLPAGAFATAVVRELAIAVDERRPPDQVRSST